MAYPWIIHGLSMANVGYPWFLDIFLVFRNFKTHLAFQDPWFLVDVSCGADRTVWAFLCETMGSFQAWYFCVKLWVAEIVAS